MTHKFLDKHLQDLEILEAHSFVMKISDAQTLMTEFESLKYHVIKLEAAILKYCGRPTKDGAKQLLDMIENHDEARERLLEFQFDRKRWKSKEREG